MANNHLIDASVLAEILKERYNKEKCLDYLSSLKGELFVSILSISIAWHYSSDPETIEFCKDFLDSFTPLHLTKNDLYMAYELWNYEDFEDALQVSSCLNNNISTIVTLDKKLAEKYKSTLQVELIQ